MNSQILKLSSSVLVCGLLLFAAASSATADDTRLLRQPSISQTQIAFAYGGDLWIVGRDGGQARRLTSTAAVESNPHFSPNGEQIAFTSNRSGSDAVYVVSSAGGSPTRLTWYPADATARGWTPDGQRVLYSSSRETAPVGYQRLWEVSVSGGPSQRLPAPFANAGSLSTSGRRIVVDQSTRWDSEWRHYRGGQNMPLKILNLDSLEETPLPHDNTVDLSPVWLGEQIYFLSDRDWVINIWSFNVASGELQQLTDFDGADIKSLAGIDRTLIFEREGYLHTLNLDNQQMERISIEAVGDFPWSEPRWEDLGDDISSASLSPTGKRVLFSARGEVFTAPVDKGDWRNLTRTSGAADRSPIWSPKGDQVAWISDSGDGYQLHITDQKGESVAATHSLSESKMGWELTWSPDAQRIAFVDDDVRIRVLDLKSGEIQTVDVGGTNIERGRMGLIWAPDSQWLAYAKTFPNNYRRIVVWSVADNQVHALTNAMADAYSPAWSRDGKQMYFLASTNLGLGTGWANTSTMRADPEYGVYALLLTKDAESPFAPESDEEELDEDQKKNGDEESMDENDASPDEEEADSETSEGESADDTDEKKSDADVAVDQVQEPDTEESSDDTESAQSEDEAEKTDEDKSEDADKIEVKIDLDQLERRILALPIPVAQHRFTIAGPEQTLFIGESPREGSGLKLHKFDFKKREVKEFLSGASNVSISNDGKKLLYQSGSSWFVVDTGSPPGGDKESINVNLAMRLDRNAEWQQMFDESWRYLRDMFYDPGTHGRDWDLVRERYSPLLPFVRHRDDLNYLMDQMSGELSVGHSFVFGGDMPDVENNSRVGVLGADLAIADGRWRIERILTYESWNPNLRAPLDRPGLKISAGHYLLAINGTELTATDDPYRWLDGTVDRQTVLQINDKPSMEGSWTAIVEPIGGETSLRQRAWVEDNRRRVDELSGGKLAYIWVPNTGQPGVVSFDRYFFAQQDKLGAVIDERFNGGGLLDDYMVDLMTRKLRAAITNEVPNGAPFQLPAGILGPKVLLINQLAGSGGDFFPWVFRQQQAGPLIGKRTWGGLVKSSVHYHLVDGGALTAPDNAVFDPNGNCWIGENEGIAPDIEVDVDARSVAEGRDPQLERAVEDALKLVEQNPAREVQPPLYSTPTIRPDRDNSPSHGK